MVNRFGDAIPDFKVLSEKYYMWLEGELPQRFGQWLYNNHVFDGEPWPELFYEEDETKAFVIATDHLFEITLGEKK